MNLFYTGMILYLVLSYYCVFQKAINEKLM